MSLEDMAVDIASHMDEPPDWVRLIMAERIARITSACRMKRDAKLQPQHGLRISYRIFVSEIRPMRRGLEAI